MIQTKKSSLYVFLVTSCHVIIEACVGPKLHITKFAGVGKSVWEVFCLAVISNISRGSIGEVMAIATVVVARVVSQDILLQVLWTGQPS